jgi:hypothetical protein
MYAQTHIDRWTDLCMGWNVVSKLFIPIGYCLENVWICSEENNFNYWWRGKTGCVEGYLVRLCSVHCWPAIEGNITYVSSLYNNRRKLTLHTFNIASCNQQFRGQFVQLFATRVSKGQNLRIKSKLPIVSCMYSRHNARRSYQKWGIGDSLLTRVKDRHSPYSYIRLSRTFPHMYYNRGYYRLLGDTNNSWRLGYKLYILHAAQLRYVSVEFENNWLCSQSHIAAIVRPFATGSEVDLW